MVISTDQNIIHSGFMVLKTDYRFWKRQLYLKTDNRFVYENRQLFFKPMKVSTFLKSDHKRLKT